MLELGSKGLSGKYLGRWGDDTSRSDRVHKTKDVQDGEIYRSIYRYVNGIRVSC